jgi:vitamin B12 transporter
VIGGRYEYDGSRQKLEYLVSTDVFKNFNILSGIEYMKINTNIEGLPSEKEVNSLFTEFLINPLKDTILNLSLRREYDSYYDHFDTGRVQLNHNFSKNITLRSSIGSGYRAPTASQLFNKTYGNKKLTPEKSLSTDVSADIKIPNLATNFYFELFENVIEDIITAPAPTYVNQQSIESLKTRGIESRIKTDINDKFSLGLSHSRVLGKQDDGDSITLVPKDKIIASIFYQPTSNFNTNIYFHYQNKAKDLKYNSLPCYKSLNVNLSYSKDKSNKIYFKIENLLDRENVLNRGGTSSNDLGYKSPNRSFYFGIKLKN